MPFHLAINLLQREVLVATFSCLLNGIFAIKFLFQAHKAFCPVVTDIVEEAFCIVPLGKRQVGNDGSIHLVVLLPYALPEGTLIHVLK